MEAVNDKLDLKNCKSLIIAMIDMANQSLDIAVFFILHKQIVRAIVNRCKDGVRVRIVLYRRWVLGDKATKHRKYVNMMIQSGVRIHWVAEDTGPLSYYRIVIIDFGYVSETSKITYVYGDQTIYVKPYNLVSDFLNLEVMMNAEEESPWLTRFEALWDSTNGNIPVMVRRPRLETGRTPKRFLCCF